MKNDDCNSPGDGTSPVELSTLDGEVRHVDESLGVDHRVQTGVRRSADDRDGGVGAAEDVEQSAHVAWQDGPVVQLKYVLRILPATRRNVRRFLKSS